MTLSDSRANVYVGRFRNTLGYRHTEYTQSPPFSHQGHHTNELCYQRQTYCDWMLFTPSQGIKLNYNNFKVYNNINLKLKKIFYLLHNNTIKTISKTAKSSVLIAIVYHLKS